MPIVDRSDGSPNTGPGERRGCSLGVDDMPSRALLGLYAFIVATSIWFMVDTGTAGELSTENKPVESVGAFMFFVGSAFFFACLVRSSSAGLRQMRNLYYLGLGLVFFMAFGEEMSWGQHIFGWGSPSAFEGN